jgi:hypothetical protein
MWITARRFGVARLVSAEAALLRPSAETAVTDAFSASVGM